MRHASMLGVVLALFLCEAPCSHVSAQVRREYSEVHMGMPVRIVLHASDDDAARAAARAGFARIAELDAMMSDYRPDSELRRLATHNGAWTKISPELFDVLARALEIARASEGAFDPTVAPLVALWREARRNGTMPPTNSLDSARALVSWRLVHLDTTARAIRLDRAGMRLDLGGIAKGYILQAAAETMRAVKTGSFMVEAGGDLVVGDPPPGQDGWVIEVPGADSTLSRLASALANAALSTSGPTMQLVEIAGVRYSHVVDPRTGLGLTSLSITYVLAAHGATSDGMATALGVMGPLGVSVLKNRLPFAFTASVAQR
ncbi:MAG: FAD:protein FMN transferase [Longimicrobiales bacterium]